MKFYVNYLCGNTIINAKTKQEAELWIKLFFKNEHNYKIKVRRATEQDEEWFHMTGGQFFH